MDSAINKIPPHTEREVAIALSEEFARSCRNCGKSKADAQKESRNGGTVCETSKQMFAHHRWKRNEPTYAY